MRFGRVAGRRAPGRCPRAAPKLQHPLMALVAPRPLARAPTAAFRGYSQLVEEAVLLFVVQLDLGFQLQRAENLDRTEAASEIRARQEQIGVALQRVQERRGLPSPTGLAAGVSVDDAMDTLSASISLEQQLKAAVDGEDYGRAADLRDQIRKVKAKQESMVADDQEAASVTPRFGLGRRVLIDGDSAGVVAGWDNGCAESPAWQAENGVAQLSQAADQLFYHVLVDNRDWKTRTGGNENLPAAYIAEERLSAPLEDGETWLQRFTDSDPEKLQFVHPLSYMLFLGSDSHGDYIPIPELRSLYGEPRRDVYPSEDGEEGGSGDD